MLVLRDVRHLERLPVVVHSLRGRHPVAQYRQLQAERAVALGDLGHDLEGEDERKD